jgi:hypothetical protein
MKFILLIMAKFNLIFCIKYLFNKSYYLNNLYEESNFLMPFNSLTFFIALILTLMIIFSFTKILLKSKKRSAESIYKLIDDLEKKYIY